MSEPKFYTVFEADSAYLKALGDTNTYFSEFEVRLKTLEALGGKIDNSITSLLEIEKKILETVGGIATTTNDIFELRKEIAKAQGLDVDEDFNIWDVAQQEPPVGPKIFTIRFLNWDGTVLETVEVEEGQTPVYSGTEPTKESDEKYDYTFNGWLPEISPANGNVDYVAQFTATEIPTITDDLTLPYVTFVAEENGSNVQLIPASKNSSPYWEYSYDLNNWTKITGNTTDLPLNKGNIVYVRGYTGYTSDSTGYYRQIKVTGKVAAYGNANALWNFNNLNEKLKEYCGYKLFEGSTGLTKAPVLPATTLIKNCYNRMFYGCTSLTQAPELPATTLAYGCYRDMFYGCTSLTTSPILPATTLANYCYSQMFYGCTSLQEITCLATDISASSCLFIWVSKVPSGGTFYKDPSMTSWPTGTSGIPEGWTVVNINEPDTPDEDPADDITLPYVTFRAEEAGSTLGLNQLSTNQTMEYSTDKTTWNTFDTSISVNLANVADEVYVRGKLSANNTTSNYTQFKMTGKIAAYGNINALWNYEDLNAALRKYCGCYLFNSCSSLTKAPELPAAALEYGCYDSMFNGCKSLTKAPELPAATLVSMCYASMFSYCTSLTEAPELPAEVLKSECYQYMFSYCTSLVKAKLLATKMSDYCCRGMFSNCSALKEITCLATSISAYRCLSGWVSNVSATGTFYKAPSMTSWPTGTSGIPEGWTVVDYAG